MKRKFLTTVLGLTLGSALLLSACGSKKETTETTEGAQQTVTESTTAKKDDETTASKEATAKLDINYDIANHLDESYADIGSTFGEPISDDVKSDSGERVVKYADPEREFHYYDDKSGGYTLGAVSAKAGDLLSFTENSVKLSDILDQLEGNRVSGLESNNAFLSVGEKGESTVVFESEGYYFVLSVGKDETVSKDGAAVILTEDTVALDKNDAATKAPSDVKIPESTSAKQ